MGTFQFEDIIYLYKARVIRVIDGDTVELIWDLGANMQKIAICRLYGIDAPEIHPQRSKYAKYDLSKDDIDECLEKERGLALRAKERVEELCLDKDIVIRTVKDRVSKFGKYLVELFPEGLEKPSVNWILMEESLSSNYNEGKFFEIFILKKIKPVCGRS